MATQHIKQSTAHQMRLALTPQPPKTAFGRFTHRVSEFLLEQWAMIIAIILGLLVLTALSIPFLSYLGLDFIAKPLFFGMHTMCAQIPSHSFYILGHQVGFCARNLSIYSSMFVGSLIFALSKKRVPGIPWWLWILMILPMAWDGGTQMFGLRESTWVLRVITGTLFGLGSVWFALPLMQKTLLETQPAPQFSTRRPVQLASISKVHASAKQPEADRT